jgi:subtilisin-like proprotein convertase family protein
VPPPDQGVPDTVAGQDGGTPQVVSKGPNLHLSISDGGYKGTLQSMRCVSLDLVDLGLTSIQLVHVTVGINHSYLGDLIIKVQDPQGLITTVLSRPGINEPVDDEYKTNGDSSNLSASYPITFRDDSSNDAEQMGSSIGSGATACKDDSICDYAPNPGAGPGTNLADFNGRNPVGTWQVCVGDGYGGDDGWVESVTLAVTSL